MLEHDGYLIMKWTEMLYTLHEHYLHEDYGHDERRHDATIDMKGRNVLILIVSERK